MKNISIIGTGYVGLVTGTCLADIGNHVICVDNDRSKIETLQGNRLPIFEPGLLPLIRKNVKARRLSFTTDLDAAVRKSDVIFIAVNTPPLEHGGADLSYVEACTRQVAQVATGYKLLVEKSTVPVQTGKRIKETLTLLNSNGGKIEVASNPEFLKEGSAVRDFLKPDRLVFGVESRKAETILRDVYKKIKSPMIFTDINSAELIKHASNSFLALKISFVNAVSQVCEKVGADVTQVALGMGLDGRIGSAFLKAGVGYGGSCFPKDVAAFIKIAEQNGYDFELLKATQKINDQQRSILLAKLEEHIWTVKGKTIALLGLAFKPNTDDLRNAPSLTVLQSLLHHGASVRAHDPVAMEKMKAIYPNVSYVKTPLDAARDADAVVLLTDWPLYSKLNLGQLKKMMRTPVFVDGRNMFDPVRMKKAGFRYASMGRPEL